MTDYLTEQEQIQLLKDWLKRYGFSALMGILVAVGLGYGWRYFQAYQAKRLAQASALYNEMLVARMEGDSQKTTQAIETLKNHFKRTPYAVFATFVLAREAVVKKDYPAALHALKWVESHAKDPAIREMALLRKARILITLNRPQEALKMLNTIYDKTFKPLVNEVRGDAYVMLKDETNARIAYEAALTALPRAEVIRPILQMKYDHLTPDKTTHE